MGVQITGSSLEMGSPYMHSGSGGGQGGPPTHPHLKRFKNWLLGRYSNGAPMPPEDSRWKRFLRWIKSFFQ